MTNPLPAVQRICRLLGNEVADAIQRLVRRLEVAWARHQALMEDREGYRAQVVAGLAAVAAAFELDPRVAALLLAVLGLHAAAFGHRPQSVPRAYIEDDDRWNPFN